MCAKKLQILLKLEFVLIIVTISKSSGVHKMFQKLTRGNN